MMVYGSYYMCKHVQNMTAGRCLKCFQEKDAPSHPSKTITIESLLTETAEAICYEFCGEVHLGEEAVKEHMAKEVQTIQSYIDQKVTEAVLQEYERIKEMPRQKHPIPGLIATTECIAASDIKARISELSNISKGGLDE